MCRPCVPGVAFSIQISVFTPPSGSSVNRARPWTLEPLSEMIVAIACGAFEPELAQPAIHARAAPARAADPRTLTFLMTSPYS